MFVYLNHFPRYVFGSICIPKQYFHRRFYSDRKSLLNHYDTLGINSNAPIKEIKTAFYKLSKEYHPDVNPNDMDAAKKFSTISNAYDILSDPIKRREYDNEFLSADTTFDRTSTQTHRRSASSGIFGGYRHTSSYGHSDMYDSDGSHFKDWYQMKEEDNSEPKVNRHSIVLKLVWLSVGLAAFFTSNFLLEMHFPQSSNEVRSRFVPYNKPSSKR